MIRQWLTKKQIEKFRLYLQQEEKSCATVEKYVRDVAKFGSYLAGNRISRERVLAYKHHLIKHYQAVSVNSMLAALNCFLRWQGLERFRVRPLKIQRQLFRPQEKELTKKDYNRLLCAAREKDYERLYRIMQTISATGIRVSELAFITAESLTVGYVRVNCKSKIRFIWLPKALCLQLRTYCRRKNITQGPVFLADSGKAVSRHHVWKGMKKAADTAGIDPQKVYPHNLRHLFARTFYEMNRDIVKLADILGHSSVETTRIYTMTTGKEHAGYLEKLGLVSENT